MLTALNRDGGKVHFAYYADLARRAAEEVEPDLLGVDVILDASHGVTVERLDRLVYRVRYGRKSVVFTLNDLSRARPPANVLGPNERFVGPIFDESGVRFHLVYNSALKVFQPQRTGTRTISTSSTCARSANGSRRPCTTGALSMTPRATLNDSLALRQGSERRAATPVRRSRAGPPAPSRA